MIKLTRKEREYRTRRAGIITAAEKIFSAKGFNKATMEEIAKESEFAEGTLYKFFKSKTALYVTLIEEKGEELLSCLREQVSRVVSPVEKIKSMVQAEMAFFEKNGDFFRIFTRERNGLEWIARKDLSKRVNKFYQTYIDFVARIIKDGLNRREFREMNPRETAYALAGLLNSFISQWFTGAKKGSLVEKAPFLTGMFLKGVERSQQKKER